MLNFRFVSGRQHGGSGGELPPRMFRFDTLKKQNVFSLWMVPAIIPECEGSMPPSGFHG